MQRTLLNFWLDVILLVLFLANLWLAFVVRFVFPPATLADEWKLWEMTYDRWADVQFGLICAFALAVLLHVMLHWTWICGVITSKLLTKRDGRHHKWDDGTRTLVGVGLLVILLNVLGVAFAVAVLMVQGPV